MDKFNSIEINDFICEYGEVVKRSLQKEKYGH